MYIGSNFSSLAPDDEISLAKGTVATFCFIFKLFLGLRCGVLQCRVKSQLIQTRQCDFQTKRLEDHLAFILLFGLLSVREHGTAQKIVKHEL